MTRSGYASSFFLIFLFSLQFLDRHAQAEPPPEFIPPTQAWADENAAIEAKKAAEIAARERRAQELRDKEFGFANFGFQQRFIRRSNVDSTNLSPMVTWNPQYRISEGWMMTGTLGVAGMKSRTGTFPGFRYSLSVSDQNIVPWFYPEVLLGAETWAASVGGGTFAVAGVEAHFPLSLPIESLWAGFHWVDSQYHGTVQLVAGLQISFEEWR